MSIHNVKNICALGTGTMGAGTALSFAIGGYDVRMYGRSEASLSKGVDSIQTSLAAMVKHGLVSETEVSAIRSRIQTTTLLDYAAQDADLVIESVSEEMDIKKGIFGELNKICPDHTIFATNTSALSPTELASVLDDQRQDNFVSMHFFNPPHLMPTVEVVPGLRTSSRTVDIACDILTGMDKEPARLTQEAPGFIVNQIQIAMVNAAFNAVAAHPTSDHAFVDSAVQTLLGAHMPEYGIFGSTAMIENARGGADIALYSIAMQIYKAMRDKAAEIVISGIATEEAIDSAFKGTLGLRMRATGPIMSADMGGLDIFKSIFSTLGIPVPVRLDQAVLAGNLGSKTGRGIYEWTPEGLQTIRGQREQGIIAYLNSPERAARKLVRA